MRLEKNAVTTAPCVTSIHSLLNDGESGLEDVPIVSMLKELEYAMEATQNANKSNLGVNFIRTVCGRTDTDPFTTPSETLVRELLGGRTNLLIWTRG
jgi:hypothetical protein